MTGRVGRRSPVVVGFDASATDTDALQWATAEAAARGCPLTVVHAVRQMLPVDPYGLLSITDIGDILVAAGRAGLGEAARHVRIVAPDVELSCRLVIGPPARVLIGESRGAGLLVLGGRRGADGPVRRVTHRVVTRAGCPVVVVHRGGLASCGGVAPRVVLDLDEAGEPATRIGFAFASARQRGIPIAAVTAPPRGGPPTTPGVDLALADFEAGYADVPVVRVHLPVGDPDALIAQSAGAAMVVIGPQPGRHLPGTGLGAAREAVLDRAGCPVAVVGRRGRSPLWPAPTSTGQRVLMAAGRLRSTARTWRITWL